LRWSLTFFFVSPDRPGTLILQITASHVARIRDVSY
jgi:hypothetical protein